jgi:hypothetical protein
MPPPRLQEGRWWVRDLRAVRRRAILASARVSLGARRRAVLALFRSLVAWNEHVVAYFA